jgi:SHAQKYF class myb-like DNA-binding protein
MSDTYTLQATDSHMLTQSHREADYEEPSNGRWTREEHLNFIKGLELHGKGWKKIAALIKTRTVVQIRTHAQKYFLKLQKARNEASGKVCTENKSKEIAKKKTKRPDMDNICLKPLLSFPNKEDIDTSLYNFLTPDYPVDFGIDMSDVYQKGMGVDALVKEAEGLEWLHDHHHTSEILLSSSTHPGYSHTSPKNTANNDIPILVKSEYPFIGNVGTFPDFSSSSYVTAAASKSSSLRPVALLQYPDLDDYSFSAPNASDSQSDDSDQWTRHAGSNIFAHDGMSSDDDIGLFFQE